MAYLRIMRYKFELSTYVQEPFGARKGCVQTEIYMRKRLPADNGHKQSGKRGVQ